jgi:hypothetical protein
MIRLPVHITGDGTGLKRAVDAAAQQAEGLNKRFEKVGGGLKKAMGLLAGGALIRSMAGGVDEAMKFADHMDNIATEVQMSVAQVQALHIAMRDAGLGGVESIMPLIAKVREFQEGVKAGGEEGADMQMKLRELFNDPLSMFDAARFADVSAFEGVMMIGRALAESGEDAKRAAIGYDILGSRARRLDTFLQNVAKGEGLAGILAAKGAQIMSDEELAALDQLDQLMANRKDARRRDTARAFLTIGGGDEGARTAFAATQEALMDPLGTVAAQVTGIFNWLTGWLSPAINQISASTTKMSVMMDKTAEATEETAENTKPRFAGDILTPGGVFQ